MKKILIYQDEGADLFSIQSLQDALALEGINKAFAIELASRHSLQQKQWQEKTALFIMPGGRDLPYHLALQGKGNQNLREYVEGGGRFLGICAGGYYGCSAIEFEKGGPIEVLGPRELKFFEGIAQGPAYGLGQFCYQSEKGARVARLITGKKESAAYFNGGCCFVNAKGYERVTVIADYADIEGKPAAIIRCKVGKGVAILSGVHPEYTVYPEIETQRRTLFQDLLNQLL